MSMYIYYTSKHKRSSKQEENIIHEFPYTRENLHAHKFPKEIKISSTEIFRLSKNIVQNFCVQDYLQ